MTPDVHLEHLDAGGGAPAAVVLLGLEELQPGAGAGLAGVILVPAPRVAQEAVTAAPEHMHESFKQRFFVIYDGLMPLLFSLLMLILVLDKSFIYSTMKAHCNSRVSKD